MTDLRQLEADLAQLREDVDYLTLLLEPRLTDPGIAAAGDPGLFPATPALGAPAPSPSAVSAHVWHALTATEAARAWTSLTGWVDWLLDRYHLEETVPECWYRHDPMIDELDALRAAWTAAYLDPNARPDEPGHWLDRLDRTLIRLRGWDRYGCTAGTHHDEVHPAPSEQARHDRERHLFADLDARARARREAATPTDA
ncbi:MAG TPA: hypothetical protein VG899_13790 [Mycobacteriales bacterium]|nr:hypothetical protein [Mycobacteriales bacterium]